MVEFTVKKKIKQITLEAKVIRKDGTVEELGIIAVSNPPIIQRLISKVKRTIGRN